MLATVLMVVVIVVVLLMVDLGVVAMVTGYIAEPYISSLLPPGQTRELITLTP